MAFFSLWPDTKWSYSLNGLNVGSLNIKLRAQQRRSWPVEERNSCRAKREHHVRSAGND
jgi:hypothetical protein